MSGARRGHPDHPVLALGGGQVDAVAAAAGVRSRGALLDLGDHPAAAARRAGGARLLLQEPPRVRGDGRGRRDARACRGLRQPLRHAARAGRGGDRARAGRALRRRLAGRPADPQLGAARRGGLDLHPAAVDRRAGEPAARRAARTAPPVVAARMAKSRDEISHWAEYDYVLVNENLPQCEEELRAIIARRAAAPRPPAGADAAGRGG